MCANIPCAQASPGGAARCGGQLFSGSWVARVVLGWTPSPSHGSSWVKGVHVHVLRNEPMFNVWRVQIRRYRVLVDPRRLLECRVKEGFRVTEVTVKVCFLWHVTLAHVRQPCSVLSLCVYVRTHTHLCLAAVSACRTGWTLCCGCDGNPKCW